MSKKSVSKSDLVDKVAKDTKLSNAQAKRAVDAVFGNISKSLKKKESVVLVGFGTFSVSHRSARTGRNPKTGAEIKIKARMSPKFKAGKSLKDAVK